MAQVTVLIDGKEYPNVSMDNDELERMRERDGRDLRFSSAAVPGLQPGYGLPTTEARRRARLSRMEVAIEDRIAAKVRAWTR